MSPTSYQAAPPRGIDIMRLATLLQPHAAGQAGQPGKGELWAGVFDLGDPLGQTLFAIAAYFRSLNFAVHRRPWDLPEVGVEKFTG